MWPRRWAGCCTDGPSRVSAPVTDRIAIGLAIVIGGLLAADFLFADGAGAFFLARRFMDLLEYLAFWR